MSRPTDRRSARVAALALPLAVAGGLLAMPSGATASAGPSRRDMAAPSPDAGMTPRSTTMPVKIATSAPGLEALAKAPPARVPTFTGSFRYGPTRKVYRYRMVGGSLSRAGTTRVASTIVPVRFHFADGKAVGPSAATILGVARSGLYSARTFPGGRGQYGDVFMRTQFWSKIQKVKRAWHVTMAAPITKNTSELTVPADKGGSMRTHTGATVHLVDIGWFDSAVDLQVRRERADRFSQFVGGNVIFCGHYDPTDHSSCGIGGYHSATVTNSGAHTYSYQSYLPMATYGRASKYYGLVTMTHELAEWLADPLLDNVVPRWTERSNPQYGCSTALEVGDPLVGRVLVIGKQLYQDEAYLAFFSREKPSTAWGHRYSWFGTFRSPSRSCTS